MDISNLLIDAQDTDTNEQKNSNIKISNHLNKTNKGIKKISHISYILLQFLK